MREFNVTGTCVASSHYMVDISGKLEQIRAMVDRELYFSINRGRQYGKTTTLAGLEGFLSDEYTVISISFEGIGDANFANDEIFCKTLIESISKALRFSGVSKEYRESWLNPSVLDFMSLSDHITDMCEDKKIVLMIDEVDSASNNRVFLKFLGMLRTKYLARQVGKDFTFHSVILVGVHDVRNIKLKLIQEGLHVPSDRESSIYNSPWNVATDFKVDMSFSVAEIESMLREYEGDYGTGMNVSEIANEIYDFTDGYPVLVSRICKNIDEELGKMWTTIGVRQAVKLILKEDSPLFQSLSKNLENSEDLSNLVYGVLMVGESRSFTMDDPVTSLSIRYGYLKGVGGKIKVANKIFEMRLGMYFVSKAEHKKLKGKYVSSIFSNDIIQDDKFNMQLCLEKFAKYYHQYYSDKDSEFLEREARFIFLFFLSPILNGRGFAHIESQFTDDRRMDVVVNYVDQQFIVELKIWRGDELHKKAYDQLLGYMDKMNLNEGYLLTFDFRNNKEEKQEWVDVLDGKKIFDVMV